MFSAGVFLTKYDFSPKNGPVHNQPGTVTFRSVRVTTLERITDKCSELGAMPTLAVGMFSRENRYMATQAWPWHPLHPSEMRSRTIGI